jgi:transcriptional regulator with XRE-family HTH domain
VPIQENTHIDSLQRSLGRRIRELRSKQGWTQEQFAEHCGVHRTYMGHVERGEKNVSLSTVLRVSNALGIRISALFGRAQGASSQSAPPKPVAASHARLHRPDTDRLLDELQAQRKALREALRDLSRVVVTLTESKI